MCKLSFCHGVFATGHSWYQYQCCSPTLPPPPHTHTQKPAPMPVLNRKIHQPEGEPKLHHTWGTLPSLLILEGGVWTGWTEGTVHHPRPGGHTEHGEEADAEPSSLHPAERCGQGDHQAVWLRARNSLCALWAAAGRHHKWCECWRWTGERIPSELLHVIKPYLFE